jgi:hypothetical protein
MISSVRATALSAFEAPNFKAWSRFKPSGWPFTGASNSGSFTIVSSIVVWCVVVLYDPVSKNLRDHGADCFDVAFVLDALQSFSMIRFYFGWCILMPFNLREVVEVDAFVLLFMHLKQRFYALLRSISQRNAEIF